MIRFFLIGIFFIQSSVDANVKECWSDSSNPCLLTGSLEIHTYPGRPNYQDIKKGDEKETGLYLKLDQPIRIHFKDWVDGRESSTTEQVTLMQLAGEFSDKFYRIAKNKNHVSMNAPVFEWQNGHHHTHFLISAKNNIVLDKK